MTAPEARRLPPDEVDGEEGWTRLTDEPEILGVEAILLDVDGSSSWLVTVCVMEFIREEPLEGEIRAALAAGLRSVPGVLDVGESDREIWEVNGSPSGEDLVRAAAGIVDEFAERTRSHYNSL